MANQYEVLTEGLAEHAKNIGGFVDRLAQAVDAAQQMSLPTDAYGQYWQALPALLNPLQDLGAAAIASCAKRLSTTAGDLREAARDYADIDDDNALAMDRMRETRM